MRNGGPKIAPRVLQLLPADGWRAVLAGDDGEPWSDPLVCWALVECQDRDYGPRADEVYWPVVRAAAQAIVGVTTGIDGYVDTPESCDNFLGYAPAGEGLECREERAQGYAERWKARRVKP